MKHLILLLFFSADAIINLSFGQNNNSTFIIKIQEKKTSAELIKLNRFSSGDTIKLANTNAEWMNACKRHLPICCYYDYNKENKELGLLFNFYAFSDKRNLAPAGLRLLNEHDELTEDSPLNFYGGTYSGSENKFLGINKEKTYTLLYPSSAYDEQKLHNVMSNLKKLFHRFLAQVHFESQLLSQENGRVDDENQFRENSYLLPKIPKLVQNGGYLILIHF